MDFKTKAPDVDGMKDYWRTPRQIWDPINARFRFNLDIATTREASLCGVAPGCYIDETMDALVTTWAGHLGAVQTRGWLNPPYSRTGDFTARSVAQAKAGAVVAALVPSTVDVRWWHRDVFGVATEVWMYTGRLAFIHPVTGDPVRGNKGGSQLVIWTPDGPGWAGTRFGTLSHHNGLPMRPADVAYWDLNGYGEAAG